MMRMGMRATLGMLYLCAANGFAPTPSHLRLRSARAVPACSPPSSRVVLRAQNVDEDTDRKDLKEEIKGFVGGVGKAIDDKKMEVGKAFEDKKMEMGTALDDAAVEMFQRFDDFRNRLAQEDENAQKAFDRFDAFVKSVAKNEETPEDKTQ